MDAIIVRCTNCKHAMKFSAEKAGKKAKCPKCQTIVVVAAEQEEIQTKESTAIAAAPEVTAAPQATAAPVVTAAPEDDDSTGGYGVYLDPELEEIRKRQQAEEEARAKKRKERKKLPSVTRKIKAIADAEEWKRVRFGLLLMFVGTCIWIACHLLQGSYVVLGKVEFPEYANLICANLEMRGNGGGADEEGLPARGGWWDVDELNLYLGMIAGRDVLGYAKTCMTLSAILYLFHALAWIAGSVISLPVPRRFGTFPQIVTSLALGGVNFLCMFVFKILPVLGITGYVMIPYLVPEIVLLEYNMERNIPIHVMWSGAPFWENFLNLIMKFLFYLQPTIGSIFIWSIGTSIRSEEIEQGGKGRTQMSLGTFFILFCFHMLSLCGASPVMVVVLRVFYTLWFCFLFLFMMQYAMLILRCRAALYEKIHPKNELED